MMHELLAGVSLDELSTFVAVAEAGSFTSAAKTMQRDASVISKRVSALEKRLGARLFARTTRNVVLTEVGERFHQRVATALEELARAGREASDLATTPRGLLRIAAPLAFGRRWIAPLLPRFIAEFPDIRVDVRFSDRYVDMVSEGFDIAVRIGALPDSALTVRKVGTYRTLLAASPGYIARHGAPETPDELTRRACLGFTGHAAWPKWELENRGRRVAVHPHCPIVADSSEALLAAALNDGGVMLAPDWLIGEYLGDGRLVEVLNGWTSATDGAVHIAYPSGRIIPAKARVFTEAVQAHLPKGWAPRRADP
ncbi:HTH-type transcriptional regulator DmlR [compost metagenome]